MMLYRALRRLARTALGWYYANVVVEGREQLSSSGPLLLVANHPNALVDAMLVGVAVPRRVLLTAKATLFEQPALAALLRAVGVVPLRRAKDEQSATAGATPSAARNADAFQMVTRALAEGGAVLVFPEGISHDAPAIAPLRTGAARMALMAHDAGVTGLRVVAVGLTYEEKERPRSRVLVRIGEPLDVERWLAAHGSDATMLTTEIDARLRHVTLNFATSDRARRAVRLARMLDAVASEVPPLHHPRPLGPEADLAHRVDAASDALAAAPESIVRQADAFIAEADTFEQQLAAHDIALSELRVSPRARHGAWFVIREAAVVALALPVAIVDRVAHDIPVRIARTFTRRSLVTDPSRDQPAMRTILLTAGTLVVWYLVIGMVLGRWFGVGVAFVALATMALSASAELALRDRVSRAWRRARSYLALRTDPVFRARALTEASRLLEEARNLERALAQRPPDGLAAR
jgi:1-acyl-sn-glycerol-3-phosphate acyltransferase